MFRNRLLCTAPFSKIESLKIESRKSEVFRCEASRPVVQTATLTLTHSHSHSLTSLTLRKTRQLENSKTRKLNISSTVTMYAVHLYSSIPNFHVYVHHCILFHVSPSFTQYAAKQNYLKTQNWSTLTVVQSMIAFSHSLTH